MDRNEIFYNIYTRLNMINIVKQLSILVQNLDMNSTRQNVKNSRHENDVNLNSLFNLVQVSCFRVVSKIDNLRYVSTSGGATSKWPSWSGLLRDAEDGT